MAILLCMIGFSSQIQVLHVNFFKAYHKQRLYFILAGISLTCAVVLYFFAATFIGTLASVAAVAVISSLLWYLLNELSFRRFVSMNIREIVKWLIVIGLCAGAFLCSSVVTEQWITGFIAYCVMLAGIIFVFLRSELKHLWGLIEGIRKRKEET